MKTPFSFIGMLAGVALIATPSLAQIVDKSAGDWLIRGRAIAVMPEESSTISVIGGEAKVDEAYMPELDISYFFSDNFATELILSTTNHSAQAVGTALGTVDVGDVWLLPPTLTAQYHFAPKTGISPYVGAGINMTLFYDSGSWHHGDEHEIFRQCWPCSSSRCRLRVIQRLDFQRGC